MYSYPGSSSYPSSDSDEDLDNQQNMNAFMLINNDAINYHLLNEDDEPRYMGSVPGHIMINREREKGHKKIWNDYFSETPSFNEEKFRRRYRMRKNVFLRIKSAIEAHDPEFVQSSDATKKLGLSSLQKMTASMRMLAYGIGADATDDYVRIGESTATKYFKRFCRAIVEIFGTEYLRTPNANDTARLLQKGEERGFPGMLGSLDCMHWAWKNYPAAWAGQYTGRSGYPTIILEAVASYDLWIWHAYFGIPGSNNDINVLQSSNLFANLAEGKTPPVKYNIMGKEYDTGYYLADGIYPKWSTLVQTISQPQGLKKQHFAMMQEACRKDVERAFGVLQARFEIVKDPARFWDKNVLSDIMFACIIMHNMVVEDEYGDRTVPQIFSEIPTVEIVENEAERFARFLVMHKQIKDKKAHFELRDTLIDHLWEKKAMMNIIDSSISCSLSTNSIVMSPKTRSTQNR